MHAILGQKRQQTQKFLEDGTRIPVTMVQVEGNPVVMVKTKDSDGYIAVQLGYATRKNPTKAMQGHFKKAQITTAPKFLKEVRFVDSTADQLPKVGEIISVESVLKPGDIIDVTGTSKGKGFAGGVKRYHFKGGPRTHGQSDRERAPGSVGQTTTPGRVYRGKRMAGKMGFETATIRNLEVMDVADGWVSIKGLVPGALNAILYIEKKGEDKKFVPLMGAKKAEEIAETVEETKETKESNETSNKKQETKETEETNGPKVPEGPKETEANDKEGTKESKETNETKEVDKEEEAK